MPILIFYLHFGLQVKFFPSYFSISTLHAFLTSPICCAADLTAFKPTHYLELGRAMRHWDRRCFRRLGFARHFPFYHCCTQTDRQTHIHTHTHTHTRHVDTAKYVYLWSQEQGFHCHVNPNMYICFPYSCYMSISSCTNFFDHCNKIAGE